MMARLLIASMVLSLTYIGIVTKAETVSLNDVNSAECTELLSEEMPVKVVEEITVNKLDRTYTGKDYVLQEGAITIPVKPFLCGLCPHPPSEIRRENMAIL